MKPMRLTPCILLLALAPGFANADVKIKPRMTAMGFSTETTTYI